MQNGKKHALIIELSGIQFQPAAFSSVGIFAIGNKSQKHAA